MIKTIHFVFVFFLLVPFYASAESQTENPFLRKDHFPGGYFLVPDSLPHFMGLYMKEGGMYKIDPSVEQEEAIEGLFNRMTAQIMATAKEIKSVETKMMNLVVYEGKSAQELVTELDKISRQRRELTELQIECINIFRKTLSRQQYDKIIELAKEQ